MPPLGGDKNVQSKLFIPVYARFLITVQVFRTG